MPAADARSRRGPDRGGRDRRPADAAGERPPGRPVRPPHPDPPLVFAVALAAMVGLAVLAPGSRVVAGAWRLGGLVPVAFGVALHRAAWRRLRAAGTPVRADGAPRALVTRGPYAWSRNPMYLAGATILLGSALLLGAATPFLVVPAYAWLADRRFLPAEERALQERFGDAYHAYRERVRRWL